MIFSHFFSSLISLRLPSFAILLPTLLLFFCLLFLFFSLYCLLHCMSLARRQSKRSYAERQGRYHRLGAAEKQIRRRTTTVSKNTRKHPPMEMSKQQCRPLSYYFYIHREVNNLVLLYFNLVLCIVFVLVYFILSHTVIVHIAILSLCLSCLSTIFGVECFCYSLNTISALSSLPARATCILVHALWHEGSML